MTDLRWKCLQLARLLFFVTVVGNCMATNNSQKMKFLFYTAADDGSHHLTNTKIAAALVRRGHDVTFLLSNSCTKWLNASDAAMFKFAVHASRFTSEDRKRNMQEMSRASLRGDLNGVWRTMKYIMRQKFNGGKKNERQLFDFHMHECDSLLGDTETIQSLIEEQFDMLIGEEVTECQPILARRLGIRFVLIGTRGIAPSKGNWFGIPSHPAYIPERQAGLTDRMTFSQRLKNFYLYGLHWFVARLQLKKFEALQTKYNLSQEKDMPEMLAKAQLLVMCGDFELEFARPLQPNVILIASPMLGLPSDEDLPRDLQDFLDTAGDEGVVLFSLGSHVNEMETAKAQMFAHGLARLSQRVIWQFSGNLSGIRIGENTKTVTWMPQSQLMDHPNTKAFINHGGLFGVQEAAWYGLPMVGIPLFGNHFDNMVRVVAKGMGLSLDITTLTEDSLYEAVNRITNEPRFRERAQHISHMMRDHPVIPSEKAAFWIAHVTKYGGEYLRPRLADLTWIQSNLIDVYAFLGAILLAVLGLLYLVCRGCFRLASRSMGQRKLKIN